MMEKQGRCDRFFSEAQRDDLCLTFGAFEPGKMPLKWAAIKTETGFEELNSSVMELSDGLLLAVVSEFCHDENLIFRSMEQRSEEIENYAKRSCVFRRNGDSNSNLFTVTTAGAGTIRIRNEGQRSLRFQTPDGMIYRVCSGCTEALTASNLQTQVAPIQILLDLNNNPLDIRVGAVYVKYGEAPWRQGGVDCLLGTCVDSFLCRIFCGDDCLGVVESYSDYYLERPRLELLDTAYGSDHWFVRNKGEKALALTWPDGRAADVPADGQIYRLETLAAYRKEADV